VSQWLILEVWIRTGVTQVPDRITAIDPKEHGHRQHAHPAPPGIKIVPIFGVGGKRKPSTKTLAVETLTGWTRTMMG
jgi:hypothetical protein